MYIAKQDFKTYSNGPIKKGDAVEGKKAWLDAGLIETKPEPKAKTETKPEPTKKKANK